MTRFTAFLPASLPAAALALLATPVLAQSAMLDADQMRDQFLSGGWDTVEVEGNETEIEIDARRGAMEIEVVYDRSTGMVRDLEIENADGRPVMIPGLTLTPAA